MENNIFEKVDHYISGLLAPEDHVLETTTRSLIQSGIPDASISPTQGKLLQVLAAACGANKILELGTLGAYSTIWLARMLPENGKLISLEFDETHAALAKQNIKNAGLENKVEIRNGKALDLLPEFLKENAGPFDMFFIDADKQPYTDYFRWAIRLARPGSIIIADNVIRNGKVLDKNSSDEKVLGVQRLNEFLSSCTEVTATILQTVGVKEHDGMVIAVVNR